MSIELAESSADLGDLLLVISRIPEDSGLNSVIIFSTRKFIPLALGMG